MLLLNSFQPCIALFTIGHYFTFQMKPPRIAEGLIRLLQFNHVDRLGTFRARFNIKVHHVAFGKGL
jgi:hypothetical protein